MKSNALPKGFPNSPEQWETLIAAAPETVAVEDDSPYNPNDPVAVEAYWANARVSHSLPELRKNIAQRRRGRAIKPLKVPTTIRFDADVLAALKATGSGWQTRVNALVRDWIKQENQKGQDRTALT